MLAAAIRAISEKGSGGLNVRIGTTSASARAEVYSPSPIFHPGSSTDAFPVLAPRCGEGVKGHALPLVNSLAYWIMPGNRGRSRRRAAPSIRTVLRHHTNGVSFHPGVDPPMIVATPWNQMTLNVGLLGDQNVSARMITPVILTQAGLTGSTATLDFRICKMRFWCLKVDRPMVVRIFGFDNTNEADGGALATLEDWPGRISFAAIGYEPPTAYRECVYSTDSTAKLFSIDVGKNNPWIAYLDILWRGNKYTPLADRVRTRLQYPQDDASTSSSFSSLTLGSGASTPGI